MSTVAAVLVTHDSRTWLEPTLASIAAQERPVDRVVVVDDGSRDGTVSLLAEHGIPAIPSTSTATDVVTRIAANFAQAVRAAEADIVLLADHDDVWLPDRVAHQAGLLEEAPEALMVASDGRLVDASGVPDGRTLRDVFPVTVAWPTLTPAERMREVVRHAVATGSASALRPAAFPELDVPPGWLHDRWWSLVAAARAGLVIDDRAVIDYRVQDGQQVGLDTAAQQMGATARAWALARQAGRSWGKQRDLRTRLRPLARDPEVAAAISLRHVL